MLNHVHVTSETAHVSTLYNVLCISFSERDMLQSPEKTKPFPFLRFMLESRSRRS
jgi:hypothetical protein